MELLELPGPAGERAQPRERKEVEVAMPSGDVAGASHDRHVCIERRAEIAEA